ncbi:hypothetical protein [Cohnella sp. GCM10012308]|uniref:hypothetical protein n=1 Tax=Cohnella sp. GCM10012308 TaxID=3317329 RepID=UPI00361F011F
MLGDALRAKVDELIEKLCDQALGHVRAGSSPFPETVDSIVRLLEAGSCPPDLPGMAFMGFRVEPDEPAVGDGE